MHGNTHAIFGATLFAAAGPATAAAIGHPLTPVGALACLGLTLWVTSLLPDNDSQESYIAKGNIPYIPRKLGFIGKLFGKVLSLPPRIIGYFIRGVMGHRQGTHSLLFLLIWTFLAVPIYVLAAGGLLFLLSIPAALVGLPFDITETWYLIWEWSIPNIPIIGVAVAIGYFSHLFSDSLNQAPVPWLWPLNRKGYFFLPPGLRIPVATPETERERWFRFCSLLALCIFFLLNFVSPVLQGVEDGRGFKDSLTGTQESVRENTGVCKDEPCNLKLN
jgi:membrane-bound metal-dependent hydrolase YbcI (DUF457 family)